VRAPTAVVGTAFARAAYVFTRTGSTWTEQAKLTASDSGAYDGFGHSVAVSGDTAVVGTSGRGAYVFTRTGSTWAEQAKLTASDGGALDGFGQSVAVSRDTTLVGADTTDVGSSRYQGAAYVFGRTGSSWTEHAKLTASDGAAFDGFGSSVSLSGHAALVGSLGANNFQGSAYVFTGAGASWGERAELTASDGYAHDLFGGSVSLSGRTALIGAPYADVGSNFCQGSAYIFTHYRPGYERRVAARHLGAASLAGRQEVCSR
jgi:hypothetical protein